MAVGAQQESATPYRARDCALLFLAPAVGLEPIIRNLQSPALPVQNRAYTVQNPMNHSKLQIRIRTEKATLRASPCGMNALPRTKSV